MAGPWYVRSSATGTGDGLSWTNAKTTLSAAATASSAGDTIYVADDHAESASATMTVTFPGTNASPNLVVCADRTVAVPGAADIKTGATITNTAAINIGGSFEMNGLTLISSLGSTCISTGASAGAWQRLRNMLCSSTSTGTAFISIGNTNANTEISSSSFKFASATSSMRFIGTGTWRNTPSNGIQGTAPSTLFSNPGATSVFQIEGVDLSAITGALVAAPSVQQIFDFKDCKIAAGVVIGATPTQIGARVSAYRTDSSGTNYKTFLSTYRGSEAVETTLVRSSGSSDGTTTQSAKLVTTANVSWSSHFLASSIPIWNDVTGTNRNVTLRGLYNGASMPTNDQIWFDVEYLGDAASGLGRFASGTKANALAAGTALTADTSAWDSNVAARANSTGYTVGQAIKVASNAGRVFFCTAAGTSAASEPSGFASAVDGGTVTDGAATFRAAWRFALTVTLSSPQPQQPGYVFAYPRVGAASSTFYLDRAISLS